MGEPRNPGRTPPTPRSPSGRHRKQWRCLGERPWQPGHQGGTGHAWSPGQQFAVGALAHRRQQPASGGVEPQPAQVRGGSSSPGTMSSLPVRRCRTATSDGAPGASAAKRRSGLARATWKAASVPSGLNTGLARSAETGTRPAGNSTGAVLAVSGETLKAPAAGHSSGGLASRLLAARPAAVSRRPAARCPLLVHPVGA